MGKIYEAHCNLTGETKSFENIAHATSWINAAKRGREHCVLRKNEKQMSSEALRIWCDKYREKQQEYKGTYQKFKRAEKPKAIPKTIEVNEHELHAMLDMLLQDNAIEVAFTIGKMIGGMK